MVENKETGSHEPLDFQHLASHVPELSQIHVDVDTYQFDKPIDSSNMNPGYWCQMAKIVVDNYDKYDGFVILQYRYDGLFGYSFEFYIGKPQ